MSQPSIKVNFIYKSALTVSLYLMSFISFPYIARVFGVERLGLVNFVDNVVNYFLLFATMGINVLGVREIAAAKGSPTELNRVFSSLLGINILFTIATLIIYYIVIAVIPQLEPYKSLLYIGAAKIIATPFLAEWFFTGIENFRYITLRSVAIRACYIVSIFIFIRTPDHYKLYWWMSVAVVVINAIVNISYLRKEEILFLWHEAINLRYMRSNLTLGAYAIMTSIYLTFNVIYLGLVTNNTQVGFYTTAFKLYSVILGFFTAFANVMLPRMSAIVAQNKTSRFRELIEKSFAAVATFSTPMILCTTTLAPQIIYALSGTGYQGAVLPMQIIMPAIALVGLSQVMTLQVLMPLKREGVLLAVSIVGATVSLIANILIVKRLECIGSAIVLLTAEVIVTAIYAIYTRKKFGIQIPAILFTKEAILCAPSVAICAITARSIENPFAVLVIGGTLAISAWSALHIKTLKKLKV